jgi:hypothetical protein
MVAGQNTVARPPKGLKAAQKGIGRTTREAREELHRRWRDSPERQALLDLASWIAERMPDLEATRSVEQARLQLAAKASSVSMTREGKVTVLVTQFRLVVRIGDRETPMLFDLSSGELGPDVAEKQGFHPARYGHSFQRVSADIGPFIGELFTRYGTPAANPARFKRGEMVFLVDELAVMASSAIHRFCTELINTAAGRPASVLGLFAELMYLGGIALRMQLQDSRELLLLAMASGFEHGDRERPVSDQAHKDRWRLLLRKARARQGIKTQK